MPFNPFFAATVAMCALQLGLFWTLLRQLPETIRLRLNLGLDQVRWLQRVIKLVLVLSVVIGGSLQDNHWGAEAIFTGVVLMALGMAGLALALPFRTVLWAAACFSFGGGCLLTTCTVLMPSAFPFSRSPAGAINLGYAMMALATFLTPAIPAWLQRWCGFHKGGLLLALACLVPASLIIILPKQVFALPLREYESSPLLLDFPLLLVGLVLVLYWLVERSFPLWLPRYLPELGYSPRSAWFLLVGFWVLFLGMRLGASWLLRPGYEVWFVLSAIFLAAVLLGNLTGVYAPTSGGLGLVTLGACFGPILPTLLGLAWTWATQAPATTLGCLFALYVAVFWEQASFQPCAGSYPPRTYMRNAMIVALVMTMLLLVLGMIKVDGR